MKEETLKKAGDLKHRIGQLSYAQQCLLKGMRMVGDEVWFGGVGSLYSNRS